MGWLGFDYQPDQFLAEKSTSTRRKTQEAGKMLFFNVQLQYTRQSRMISD